MGSSTDESAFLLTCAYVFAFLGARISHARARPTRTCPKYSAYHETQPSTCAGETKFTCACEPKTTCAGEAVTRKTHRISTVYRALLRAFHGFGLENTMFFKKHRGADSFYGFLRVFHAHSPKKLGNHKTISKKCHLVLFLHQEELQDSSSPFKLVSV